MAVSQTVLILILNVVVWMFYVLILSYFYIKRTRGDDIQKIKRKHEKREYMLIISMILILASIILTICFMDIFIIDFEYYIIYYIGIIITLFGEIFLIWTLYHLGNMWSLFVSTMEDHILIQTGPYKLARHPMYLSLFILYIGLFISSGGWLILITLLINICISISRFRQEERLMIIEFGDEYINYMKMVGAFCPFTCMFDCGVNPETEPKKLLQAVQDKVIDPGSEDDVGMEATDDNALT
eukprot:493454_1